MHTSGDHDLPSWDAEGGGDPEEDPGEELEAMIAKLPHLNLKPLPLLAAAECSH